MKGEIDMEKIHEIIISREEKPHKYEFGKAGNRHTIKYSTIEELKTHIKLLEEVGLTDISISEDEDD
jgi:hypothetical protein